MDIVVNDYSIDSQFANVDEFLCSLLDNTIVMLKLLNKFGVLLLKNYTTYQRPVTDELSLFDVLSKCNFRGYPEIQKLRSLLVSMTDEPYWNDTMKSDVSSVYLVDNINCENISCFSEAYERDCLLCSFMHGRHKFERINVAKNGVCRDIHNVYDRNSAIDFLFRIKLVGFSEYVLNSVGRDDLIFYKNKNRFYADEVYDDGKLNYKDCKCILDDFIKCLKLINNNVYNSKFSDDVKYKNYKYYEFITKLDNKREFRIYYFIDANGYMVCLNSLLKKTEKIPDHVKRYTVELMNNYNRMHN